MDVSPIEYDRSPTRSRKGIKSKGQNRRRSVIQNKRVLLAIYRLPRKQQLDPKENKR